VQLLASGTPEETWRQSRGQVDVCALHQYPEVMLESVEAWELKTVDRRGSHSRRVLISTEFGSMVEEYWPLTRAAVEARTSSTLDSMVA
jgi:hypothetical protein